MTEELVSTVPVPPEGKPADQTTAAMSPSDILSDQISNDLMEDDKILSDDRSSVSVVEEEEDVGEVEIPEVKEKQADVVMTSPAGELDDKVKEEESSDSVEVVEEAHPEVKEDVEDVVMEDVNEIVMQAEDIAIDEEAPVVELESVPKVESAPATDETKASEELVDESDKDAAGESSSKESASEDGLLSDEVEETTEISAEEEPQKRFSLIHLICSIVLVGALIFLSVYSESGDVDPLTTGLSTLFFVYLTTFAAADLEMIDPGTAGPWLITAFNSIVCPFLLTFLLGNPALRPAEEVGLMTPVLAWLLGIELWIHFDKLDLKKMAAGVVVALCGFAGYLYIEWDEEVLENEEAEIIEG